MTSSVRLAFLATLLLLLPLEAQIQQANSANVNQNVGQQDTGTLFTGTGTNLYYGVNLVPFGPEVGDQEVNPGLLTAGQTIDLHMYFPFYGGLYNYSTLSVNGYIGFATVLDQGPTLNVGPDMTDWPRHEDPAMIAPYLCKQQIPQNLNPGMRSGVFYRLMMRQSLFGRQTGSNMNMGQATYQSSFFGQSASKACPGTPDSYVRCDSQADYFLEEMQRWLIEGVAGAAAFRADAALVVTWYNTASAISGRSDIDSGQLATYQAIWLTDRTARLSYVILNYDRLGFDAADFRQNSRSGRCQALFNGGNHTGLVPVDPTQDFKNTPKVLAQRSGVPQMVRGRYMFRVDDVVRPAGCSNKTGGTYPMLIYPNIVNMLGEMTVDVNAICLDKSQTYILMIEQRQTATCTVLTSAIARCNLPKIFDWGTKTVYFQPQSGGANDEKAFVGYIYFVPPTLDPMRLDIGNVYDWFKNPLPYTTMPLVWYPRNFTNPEMTQHMDQVRMNDDTLYSTQLGLYVIAYREYKDDTIKKFRPEHRVICRLATYSNRNTYEYRWKPQEERINLYQVEQWYMNDWERQNDLYHYRFGYLKLAPLKTNQEQNPQQLLSGLVSSPISLHFLWTSNNPQFATTTYSQQDESARTEYVKKKSLEMCHDWYDEDGAQWNFIRDTETNSSCPCIERQAIADIGRFMPHPRCSQAFRDITCTTSIGSRNCYMSSQNVMTTYAGDGRQYNENLARFPTHYGQVCCYDDQGHLMQTSYQPVIKVTPEVPYNPGFPMRAYEFGTAPYMGQYEVPGLSAFHNDYMPYFLCCKFADFRCQMFYWRRPSSGCQEYQPPAYGEVMGAGTFNTIDNDKFIFNEPGVYNGLYIPHTLSTPEVKVQIRMERYPNRRVDFSLLGRYMAQQDLVQPTNATVVTGVVLEATGTDRVHVVARKDTRRFRYRTSIIVGNILRYFDTMRIQRFKGVMIYVNNVERGQPEIYVVLEEAQIGIRVRESYAIDIDRLSEYQESMGILNIAVSVPPQYGVRPDGDKTREQEIRQRYNLPRVSGVFRPFPDQSSGSYLNTLTLNDVNSETYRQQIINMYRVQGSGEPGSDQNINNQGNNYGMPTENMFTTSRDEDKKFEVFPEAQMKSGPIFKTSPKYETGAYRFYPMTGQVLNQRLQTCRDMQQNTNINMQPLQSQLTGEYGQTQCPDNPSSIIQDCGDSVPCLYDYYNFNAKLLGLNVKNEWNTFTSDRFDASRQYNSCGVINIEYPEYLMKTSSMSSAYLQGDVARFECFQSHWIYGVHEYKCGIVVDRNQRNIIDPRDYRFEWNKGEQPWCRSREKQNFLTWLAIIGGIFGVLVFVILIFLCCWIVKQKKKGEAAERRGYDMASRSSMTGSRGGKKYPIHESEPLNEKRFDADTYRDDDFYPPAREEQYAARNEDLHGLKTSV
ncbi:uncharacterized protein CELE_F54D1.6 [Caenorhabditis elegans]|uniref:Uncharacterized protein F54D1.6 n=1 Tax=Caenorhabditis elegans TaxID=6239 RepID=YAO6_CAEEL|nr:Uncharacterized protein CELE_F54D1.6 [Caenorhabditis elegans]Q20762.4 RecName: Full=Uncharacterized protein F54D1.6; Flags: Precursor [Caenorhabditis elegans]CAB00863.2 Uncharacterized protein CELE_F54D1.6 [Caenorhabditis elegans]|eukprot:NP_502119.2 Uncharacterized protein CELE_F54D1.6 [Caenorhabditis elegans]